MLNPELDARPEWTTDEDARLVELVVELSGLSKIPWSRLARQLGTRTDSECKRRWRKLQSQASNSQAGATNADARSSTAAIP